MIINKDSPNAWRTHLIDKDGVHLTKKYAVVSYNTETGVMLYYEYIHTQSETRHMTRRRSELKTGIFPNLTIEVNETATE